MGSKRVPEVRFKGFSDDEWEEKKLRELASFAKGNGYSKSDLIEEGEPIILYGRLYTKYQTVIEEVDTFTKIKEKSLISKGYEVIVPSSGETSEDISRASVVKRSGVILGGDLNVIYPSDEINSIFLALTISNGNQQKELSKKAQGKSVVHLHNSDLKEVNLYYPKKEEQVQIGNFFKQLDETIAFQQQELDTLKQTKQGFLQKMFPKEGESLPEIRFPGFSGEWEKSKLNDIGIVEMCKRIFKNQTTVVGDIPFYKIGTFGRKADSFISRELFEEYKSKYPFPEVGDILISASGTIGRTVVYNGEDAYYQDSNIVWLKPNKDRVKNCFLQQFYQIVKWHGTEGSTIKRLYNSKIRETEIYLPSISEQELIGRFFNIWDNTIFLYEQELDILKQTKKAFLQKMFV
ncbi:restriction endonuclease subunit S [Bacillus safensis]|uniref:restriction endonuclease subunit S n=1 Tax=Bacillus safensis TaxID=561879 RepID=UPI00366C8E87